MDPAQQQHGGIPPWWVPEPCSPAVSAPCMAWPGDTPACCIGQCPLQPSNRLASAGSMPDSGMLSRCISRARLASRQVDGDGSSTARRGAVANGVHDRNDSRGKELRKLKKAHRFSSGSRRALRRAASSAGFQQGPGHRPAGRRAAAGPASAEARAAAGTGVTVPVSSHFFRRLASAMWVLAERVEHHEGHRPLLHGGAHHQAMAGSIGEAGLAQLDVPVVLAHQGIGIAKAQRVVGLAEGHGLLVGGAECWISGY